MSEIGSIIGLKVKGASNIFKAINEWLLLILLPSSNAKESRKRGQ
jgi:hypothetical protein